MAFNIRKYLGIDGSPSAVNHDNKKNPIPDELLGRVEKDINELIGYITGTTKGRNPDQPPKTKEEFEDHLHDAIKEDGLSSFYPPNDPRVTEIAKKASELLNDQNYPLNGKPDLVAKVARRCLYDIVLYCDDSLSMTQENRIATQVTFCQRLARIILPMRRGAITLRFINYNGPGTTYDKITDENVITQAVKTVPYTGYTPIGGSLKSKILDTMFYPIMNSSDPTALKPLFVMVITDGWPYNEADDHMKNVILESLNTIEKKLGPVARENGIKYQINQIGHEQRSTQFILGLHNDPAFKGNVYCTSEVLDDKIEAFKNNAAGLDEWITKTVSEEIKPKKG